MIPVNSVIFGDDMLNQRRFFVEIVVINFCQIFLPKILFMLYQIPLSKIMEALKRMIIPNDF